MTATYQPSYHSTFTGNASHFVVSEAHATSAADGHMASMVEALDAIAAYAPGGMWEAEAILMNMAPEEVYVDEAANVAVWRVA